MNIFVDTSNSFAHGYPKTKVILKRIVSEPKNKKIYNKVVNGSNFIIL